MNTMLENIVAECRSYTSQGHVATYIPQLAMVNPDKIGIYISTRRQERIAQNYRSVLVFNGALIALGAVGILPPTTSALLHNTSTLRVSVHSMTNLFQ